MTILDAYILVNFPELKLAFVILEGRTDWLEDLFLVYNIELTI